MGRLNKIIASINDTQDLIIRVKRDRNPLAASANKESLDHLHGKLHRLQTDLNNLGREENIIQVVTSEGFIFFTGITLIEAKELIAYRYRDAVIVQYNELIPGTLIKKNK